MHDALILTALACVAAGTLAAPANAEEGFRKRVIRLEVRAPEDSAGGLIAADVDDDGRQELLVTAPGYVGAYAPEGRRLWSRRVEVRVGGQSESQGLPGHHGPGIQAADIDGDGKCEVLFLDQQSRLHVLAGATGFEKWSMAVAPPAGAERWEHVVVANFRGEGDRDLLLQATNRSGYRMGRYVAAFSAEALRKGVTAPLWQRDDFLACAHNGARVADLDGDGRDEVLGPMILGPDGKVLLKAEVRGHIDSVFVADVRPEIPGLEVVLLEEGRDNRVLLLSAKGMLYEAHHRHQEPQNAAIGRFLPGRKDIQVWCRSRYNEHQKPFVFNAAGELIAEYEMDRVAPQGWTPRGVEVIHTIDWTGEERQLAAAKERHKSGDVCVFDPISGEFVLRIAEQADRLYVADVTGDWREELVVWSGQELHIYENTVRNPRPREPRLWRLPHYRRSKMTWNYYSP